MMVGVFSLLTARRIFLAFVVVLIAVGVAGRLAAAAESQGPSASFTFDPGAPLSGEQITFTSTSSDDGTIVDEDWDFGDGQTGSGSTGAATPTRCPASTRCRLTVTDDESLTATHSEDVTVGNRNPSAEFHYSPAAPQVGDTVSFTSDATDPRTGSTSSAGTWTATRPTRPRARRVDQEVHGRAARTRSPCWWRTGTAAPTRSARRST